MTAPCGTSARRAMGQRDEAVAHILTRQVAIQHQPLGLIHRHVLHRMHGDVDLSGGQRHLDLLGEEALAPHLAQRLVLDPVACDRDHHHLERLQRQVEMGRDPVAGLMRLGQG